MGRGAPPLEAVEAFVAAMGAASFRAAAARMALSASAFSRRIQRLEAFVGRPLFDRSSGTPQPTPAGRAFYGEVQPALAAIRSATASLREEAPGAPFRVLASHSLTVNWLLPRLAPLRRALQGREVEVETGADPTELHGGTADAMIIGGAAPLAGCEVAPIIEVWGRLAAAPRLADGRRPPAVLSELAGHRLLAPRRPPQVWRDWLEAAGYQGAAVAEPRRFETLSLSYEAACAGLGLALAVPLISERYLAEGRLVSPMADLAPTGSSYSLVFADASARRRPTSRRFEAWLRNEMEAADRCFRAAA